MKASTYSFFGVSATLAMMVYADVGGAQSILQDPTLLKIGETMTKPVFGAATMSTMFLAMWLLFWRQCEALDSTRNQSGWFQWSSMFYRTGGAVTDFINGLPFIINLAPLGVAVAGMHLGGVCTWSVMFVGHVVVPIADLIVGEDSYNPTPEEESQLRKNVWFRIHSVGYVPVYVATIFYVCAYIAAHPELTMVEFLGISTSVGIASGFGIGCIHELCHRPSFIESYACRTVLCLSNYNHFWIEHLWGHHKRVATDEDPASSALNEPFWTFIWKCLFLSFKSACQIENQFQKNQGRGFFCVQNRILTPYLISFAIDYYIYTTFGATALKFHLLQSFLTAFYTDNANYIEHYGLRRKRLSDRKDQFGLYDDYERPGWMHSWNTGDRISNWMLFKIERHPDHHVNAGRPYQILRTYKESPTYPTGYAGMILLSWFPPLFFAVMNPLVRKAHADYKQQLKDGSYYKLFPKGANNMSSVYCKEGEGFYEKGSSNYAGGEDSDFDKHTGGAVWTSSKERFGSGAGLEKKNL
jgi:alkane 1-monooxygenase